MFEDTPEIDVRGQRQLPLILVTVRNLLDEVDDVPFTPERVKTALNSKAS
jgi:hypothetical protein